MMPQMPQMGQLPQAPQITPQMSPQLAHMQQQQQQQQLQQQRAAFSPTQHSPSPTTMPQQSFAMPPNKRPRTEPGPLSQQLPQQQQQAQQQQTFHAQQYAINTQNQAPSPSAASPSYLNSPTSIQPQNYASPYGNGGQAPLTMPTPTPTATPLATPTLHMPEARQTYGQSPSIPTAPVTPSQQYTNATMMPIAPVHPPQGAMGPPSKPAERPTKEYEYDVSDSLAGTGIDLRAEEQALADFYAGSFAPEARTGIPANAPGGKSSMYGAGWANQPAEPTDAESQEKFAAEAAQKAWDEAAQRLAVSRSNEMREPFLQISTMHSRAEKIAKEHGISLNLDLKSGPGSMGRMKAPIDFPQPKVNVGTKVGPDGVMVTTSGSWIPHDAYLVDQLALLSIATKHRLRELIEEAVSVAINRQTTSNGEVPEEWADVAVPLQTGLSSLPEPDSAVSPLTNPLKRSFDVSNAQSPMSVSSVTKNPLTKTMREIGEGDRKVEDARLKKRQKRQNPETPASGARSGTAAPGTPGGVAPDEVKAPSKKELKKGAAAARIAEASSTASANQTLNTLIGGFGGRKKGKQYSWMTGGGSGASTPSRLNTPGTPGAAAVSSGAKAAPEVRPTLEGRTQWGKWRDSIMGKNIQLRDWVTALEMDGSGTKTIQDAYLKLDASAK